MHLVLKYSDNLQLFETFYNNSLKVREKKRCWTVHSLQLSMISCYLVNLILIFFLTKHCKGYPSVLVCNLVFVDISPAA